MHMARLQEAGYNSHFLSCFFLHHPSQVKTPDESRSVGRISKQWGGLLREALTDADDFGLQFPLDLDVRVKAVLLGATFLIVSQLPLLRRDRERSHAQEEGKALASQLFS